MSSREWDNLGKTIRDMVESAVDTRDYAKLDQSIRAAVDVATKSMGAGVQAAAKSVEAGIHTAESAVNQWQTDNTTKELPKRINVSLENRNLFSRVAKHQVVGGLMAGMGFLFTGMVGLVLLFYMLMLGAAFLTWDAAAITALGMLLVFFAGFLTLGIRGSSLMKRAGRFKRYVKTLKGKEYVDLEQLTEVVHKPIGFVRKDIKQMISKRWFCQGHLDAQKSCLMVTDKLYEEYVQTQKEARALRLEEEQRAKILENRREQKEPELKSEEQDALQGVLDEGNRYIVQIRQCNDDIPGEEISNKISKMELIIQRIFERVKHHPENIPDIQKLMEYYLPTTIKLLEAYKELDAQPAQGENIAKSKAEIENTLDTLNVAFEKLLDELFRGTAWDVSTDISVLNTVLAQEGLTKGDFK